MISPGSKTSLAPCSVSFLASLSSSPENTDSCPCAFAGCFKNRDKRKKTAYINIGNEQAMTVRRTRETWEVHTARTPHPYRMQGRIKIQVRNGIYFFFAAFFLIAFLAEAIRAVRPVFFAPGRLLHSRKILFLQEAQTSLSRYFVTIV